MGSEVLLVVGLVVFGLLLVGGGRARPRQGGQGRWHGPDALEAAIAVEAEGRGREDLLACSDANCPDAERARALRRVAAYLPKEHLGPLLGFMGSSCGALTCAEIFRLARFHPVPATLERAAMMVIEETGSDTLRLMAVEALAEMGGANALSLLERVAGAHRASEVRSAASRALARIDARLRQPPRLDGALSVTEDEGSLSEAEVGELSRSSHNRRSAHG